MSDPNESKRLTFQVTREIIVGFYVWETIRSRLLTRLGGDGRRDEFVGLSLRSGVIILLLTSRKQLNAVLVLRVRVRGGRRGTVSRDME